MRVRIRHEDGREETVEIRGISVTAWLRRAGRNIEVVSVSYDGDEPAQIDRHPLGSATPEDEFREDTVDMGPKDGPEED